MYEIFSVIKASLIIMQMSIFFPPRFVYLYATHRTPLPHTAHCMRTVSSS